MIYENLYSKTFFIDNGKGFGQGYLCIKLTKNAWGSLDVELTDGFRTLAHHTCSSLFNAVAKIKLLKEVL